MRVGHGYDVHRLIPRRKCIIGGVDIPHQTGLDGHSHPDVLTHPLMDPLLGALAGFTGVCFVWQYAAVFRHCGFGVRALLPE